MTSAQSNGNGSVPPLQGSYLADLCAGDAGFERELLQEYLLSTPTMASRCRLMFESHDAKGLEHWAHTLKSSCRTVGALTLADLCQELELRGRDKMIGEEPSNATSLIEAFAVEVSRVEDFVTVRIKELEQAQ